MVNVEDPESIVSFEDFLEALREKFTDFKSCTVTKNIVDKRRKIPHAKIFLRFFGGTTQKNNMLISYRNGRA